METLAFEQQLQRYAELTVKVGLNLQLGQRLTIVASPLDVAPLVRSVAEFAYQNGCRLVTVMWLDEQLDRIRHQHAPRDSFEEFASWLMKGTAQCMEGGDALLLILSFDLELLKDQDPEQIEISGRTFWKNFEPIRDHQSKIQYSGQSYGHPLRIGLHEYFQTYHPRKQKLDYGMWFSKPVAWTKPILLLFGGNR